MPSLTVQCGSVLASAAFWRLSISSWLPLRWLMGTLPFQLVKSLPLKRAVKPSGGVLSGPALSSANAGIAKAVVRMGVRRSRFMGGSPRRVGRSNWLLLEIGLRRRLDDQFRHRNVRRQARDPEDRIRHVFCFENLRPLLRGHRRRPHFQDRRVDLARVDAAHPDVALQLLARETASQGVQAELTRGIA